jgi:predicted nucleic acid-binding protein
VIVLDSSAVVDYLFAFDPNGSWVADRLAEDADVHVPHVVDVEVLGVVRRGLQNGAVTRTDGAEVLDELGLLPMRRYPHGPFLLRAWELRGHVNAADAIFIALAEALDAPLVTTDLRLARAAPRRVRVKVP